MNRIPNMHADVIPFYGAAGFLLGMNFNDFICDLEYIISDDDIEYNWYSYDDLIIDENTCYLKDEIIYDFFNDNIYERIITCYWNRDIMLVFHGKYCTLKSITVSRNYKGKLLKDICIGDKILDVKKEYELEFYSDVYSLVDKEDQDKVIGAELITNYLSEYSDKNMNQKILSIRIYDE